MAKVQRTKKTDKTSELSTIRHSASHIMAEAILNLYPETKLGFGPATEDGFYYDFDFKTPITDEDLTNIESEMIRLLGNGRTFERSEKTITEALKWADKNNQSYKADLINRLKEKGEKKVSFYTSGSFTDLCEGPHVKSVQEIGAFKLLSLAGAYWHGDEKNPQLTRIYATAFATQKELDEYLAMLEEAKKRDHRKLGKELDLYSVHEEAGPGLIYWHPKGARVRLAIEDFWRAQHLQHGYEMLYTPHLGRSWLWETSGHLDFYRESMYAAMEIDEQDYYIKPMNCPFHIMIYKTQTHSYRDLPLRWAELGTVYRYEKSGVLHGLLRVRGFTQDDAHIICTPDQIEDEILRVLKFSLEMWKAFGFKDIKAYLATKPEKSVGSEKDWDKALKSLRKAVEAEKLDYEMDEGGGAFYGPKIDLKIKDALGREWQMTTIQFDFNLPERFDMTFADNDGKEKRPFMVHRALLGSIERFFGVLIEHYAGAFPFWLAPVQAIITPISDKQNKYANELLQQLKSAGVRAELDDRNESLGRKIRDAQTQKIPMILVIGPKEVEAKSVTLRDRDKGDLGSLPIEEAVTRLSALTHSD